MTTENGHTGTSTQHTMPSVPQSGQSGSGDGKQPINSTLEDNLRYLESVFDRSSDIIFMHWQYGPEMKHKACSIYYSSLIQDDTINYMKISLQDLVAHEVGPGMEAGIDEVRFFREPWPFR